MGDVSSGNSIRTGVYNYKYPTATAVDGGLPRFKVGYLTAPATTDDGDTVVVDLYAQFGITTLLGVQGYIQTTAGSVIAAEAPTTAMDGYTLTLTVGGSTDNKVRTYIVYGI